MALNTLGDIYNYCNNDLLDGELVDIYDIINYLEEAQNLINTVNELEAPIASYTLDSTCQITLPTNCSKVKQFSVVESDSPYVEEPIEPTREWAKTVYFPSIHDGKTIKIYYYKKPAVLNPTTLSQVPDIDPKYFFAMAQYSAEMFKLKDDDTEAVRNYREKFLQGLTSYSTNNRALRQFKNVW